MGFQVPLLDYHSVLSGDCSDGFGLDGGEGCVEPGESCSVLDEENWRIPF